MKTLVLALFMLASTVAFVPTAEAGQYAKVRDRDGRVTYVHKSQVYRDWPYSHSGEYRHYRHHRSSRNYYSYPRAPRYYRNYDDRERPRYYSSRPRFSVRF
jgi:hypothetical protein